MANKSRGNYKWIDKAQAYELYATKVNGKYPTMQDVADMLGRPLESILRLAAKDKWKNRRDSVIKNAQEKFSEEMADIAKAEKYKEFQDWNLVEDVITDALAFIRRAQNGLATATDLAEITKHTRALKSLSYDMLNFTTALKTAKHGKRTLLGVPTDITRGELSHDVKNTTALEELREMADFIKKNQPKNDTGTGQTN